MAERIVEDCLPHSGNSIRVGITGVPGAGKSSVIEVLGTYLIGEYGQKVAVLAIDPSSQISGGSILGDKTRMNSLASSDMAFIRPSPSRGSLGGVAQRTREAMLLCEAAGYQNILVETVGVGQSETAVHDMVDFFLLIMLAGAGDELQGMKRGVMELADIVAINKADGTNLSAAERARAEAQNALHYFPGSQSGWTPRALTCSAQTGKGIAELWNCVLEYAAMTKANGWFSLTRRNQTQKWMQEIIRQGLRQRFESHPVIREAHGGARAGSTWRDALHLFAPRANCSKFIPMQSLTPNNLSGTSSSAIANFQREFIHVFIACTGLEQRFFFHQVFNL